MSSVAASSEVDTATDRPTRPVPGTKSANRSFDSVSVSPLASVRTRAPRQDLRRRPHVERITALERKIVRPATFTVTVLGPAPAAVTGTENAIALLGGELEGLRLVPVRA